VKARITSGWMRWIKFNAVGGIGILVQLGTLTLLSDGFSLNYLLGTAISVEAAVLHNFLWHERFTWADRRDGKSVHRLIRFNLSTGAISIFGNVVMMKLLAGVCGANYFVANLVSITVCSFANFAVGDRWVFPISLVER
jgi:putative flippase GtrA